MTEPTKRTPLQAKLDAISRRAEAPRQRLTWAVVARQATKILALVEDAKNIRQSENRSAGRPDAEDFLLEVLDLAEVQLSELGAMPRVRR